VEKAIGLLSEPDDDPGGGGGFARR